MAWRTWGFAGFCMLLSISAKNSKEAASTTPENVCWKGSTCWKKGTSSLGMVQISTKGGTSSMMEKIELENMQDDSGTALAEEKEMERSMQTVPACQGNSSWNAGYGNCSTYSSHNN